MTTGQRRTKKQRKSSTYPEETDGGLNEYDESDSSSSSDRGPKRISRKYKNIEESSQTTDSQDYTNTGRSVNRPKTQNKMLSNNQTQKPKTKKKKSNQGSKARKANTQKSTKA